MDGPPNNTGLFAKRTLDACVAAVALVLLLPLFVAVGVSIKLLSPGPIFYFQERIGRHHRSFRICKFRTMNVGAANAPGGSVTVKDDPRIFSGGHLLRRLKIDELPQLWNVLMGSMSLVGPRPTVAEDYDRMTPRQKRRTLLPPGITGLAQIRGGTELTWPERIELDLAYIEQRTMRLDLFILAETGWKVLTARAETHPPGSDEWRAAA